MNLRDTLRRYQFILPGYDHIIQPCKPAVVEIPGRDVQCSHGRHGEEWIYSVATRELALTFTVYSRVFPSFTPPEVGLSMKGMAADMTVCEAVPYRMTGHECPVLHSCCETIFTSALRAGQELERLNFDFGDPNQKKEVWDGFMEIWQTFNAERSTK